MLATVRRALRALGCAALALVLTCGPTVQAFAQQAEHANATLQDFYVDGWTTEYAGSALSLAGYTQTFSDSFNSGSNCPEVGTAGQAPTTGQTFFAQSHAPAANGSGAFSTSNYSCAAGHLALNFAYTGGVWTGAQLGTLPYGGFSGGETFPTGSYVQITARFPTWSSSLGTPPWASFWFESTTSEPAVALSDELDFFESGLSGVGVQSSQLTSYYIHGPATSIVTGSQNWAMQQSVPLPWNIVDGNQHVWTIKFLQRWDVLFIDGFEVERFPIRAANERLPMALILDITAPPVGITAPTSTTYSVEIDSVTAGTCNATSVVSCT